MTDLGYPYPIPVLGKLLLSSSKLLRANNLAHLPEASVTKRKTFDNNGAGGADGKRLASVSDGSDGRRFCRRRNCGFSTSGIIRSPTPGNERRSFEYWHRKPEEYLLLRLSQYVERPLPKRRINL